MGALNWEILRRGIAGIVEVSDETVLDAMWILHGSANLKVEPTGALAVAALLKNVVCILSGGNVNSDRYAEMTGFRSTHPSSSP